ncbi:MAG: tRNA (N(6)-L-threonylcarbamoyladenosine(37)-C(2))-methylthiotransferase MtaB [Candidatus Izemoplasmatales bacterium]|nr:tRNA (N(6)-L-threonylcarbamoyladenosine(37)-C(2))-methylthiotransferase MtaB [Candidatus Izemoplasmatales bacterium]
MKVAITTLGCKVNSYESEAVITKLEELGYTRTEFNGYSDIYIINTCMVTNTGEAKSRKMIRHPLKFNENAIVIVMGCLTQLKAEEILEIPGVKIVLGTSNRELIPTYIEEFLQNHIPLNKVKKLMTNEPYDHLEIKDFKTHQRAFLKIQDGCNNFCTYCIIPYTRGRVRSKTKDQVLSEARTLVAKGHLEIILTGIHTGGYGEDLTNYSFADLLMDLEEVEGLKRIRISSIEITELTDQVIDIIASSSKIVNHLHIPLQSGSNRVLKLMNRKYQLVDYEKKITSLRNQVPNLAITTDVIVGFPTETEEDFLEMVEFIKKIQFSELHIFPYSKRTGTVASKMTGEVSPDVKKERVNKLISLNTELAKKFISSQLFITQNVIVETAKNGDLSGHTANYIHVQFQGNADLVGKLVKVQIIEEKYPESISKLL